VGTWLGCGTVRVKYWPTDDLEAEVSIVLARLEPDADFTGRATLSDLYSGLRYSFSVETMGGARNGSFRTPAAEDDKTEGDWQACSFVFGSCVGGQGYGRLRGDGPESGFPAFAAMLAAAPDFFVCNGDFIYADNAIKPVGTMPWNKGAEHVIGEGMKLATTLGGFRARYRYHLADPKLQSFLANTPMLSTWDDHEIVDDWGAEWLIAKGEAQLLEDGLRAWFEYQPYVSPFPSQPRRVYRTQRWGLHVEGFVLDTRSYRSKHTACEEGRTTPQMKSILGAAQLSWLLEALSASTATWKMICTSVPLSYPTGWPRPEETGFDGWSDGSSASVSGPEKELLSILAHIRDHAIANVVFISGDVHFPFCISYDPFKQGKPLCYEIGATPIHALCLPTPPPGRQDTSLNPSVLYAGHVEFGGKLQNFGRCAVDDKGVATFSLHTADGEKLYALELPPTNKGGGTMMA